MSKTDLSLQLLNRTIDRETARLEWLRQRPFQHPLDLLRTSRKVRALNEAQRDVLNTAVTGKLTAGQVVDKNNYKTYERQVQGAYEMYDGLTDYGSELVAMVVDLRVAFIAGEGVSFRSENKAKADFVRRFFKFNCLDGSKLIAAVLMAELEGKALFTLTSKKADDKTTESNVVARLFSWYTNRYKVERDQADLEQIKSITYKKDKSDSNDSSIDIDRAVYVKTGGASHKDDLATTKIGKVLTQCENASRAGFDLRKNTHVFGKYMPYWKTLDIASAKAINNDLSSKSFEIGDGYAGMADFTIVEPSGRAAEAVIKDMLNSLRYVAAMTGVPIHWMAWPELMSNRATAENMLEVVSAATKRERLIWQESLRTLVDKALQMGVDELGENASVLEGEYELRLPLISLAALQQMVDIWLPMRDGDVVSTFTLRNMLPGIDPDKEAELIEQEKEKRAEDSPFQNAADGALEDLQEVEDGEPDADAGAGGGGKEGARPGAAGGRKGLDTRAAGAQGA